jgi:hypothetical protein
MGCGTGSGRRLRPALRLLQWLSVTHLVFMPAGRRVEPIVAAFGQRLRPSRSPRRLSGWQWPSALADFDIGCIARLCLIVAALYFGKHVTRIFPLSGNNENMRKLRRIAAACSMT